MRTGTAQENADTAGVADDDGANFQQGQAQGIRTGSCQPGLLQCPASQSFKQGVGQTRE